MSLLLQVCFAFLKVGAFSFGGGYAVLTFIQRDIVEVHGWIAPDDFVSIVAIAEMTPGPLSVNASTFVGFNLFGAPGGVLCSLCTLAVPFALSLLAAVYFTKFKDSVRLKAVLTGIRPAVIGLIAAAFLSVVKISVTSVYGLLFFGVALLLVWKCKVNPILTLVICGALGGGFYGLLLPALGR